MLYTERIPIIQVSEIVMEMADSETPITVASEIPIQMVVSETVMVASEIATQEDSETVIQEDSEIHNPMADSVILRHRQGLIIIISNSHSRDIITIMEASDLMIPEVSDLAEASTAAEAAASEVVLLAEVAE